MAMPDPTSFDFDGDYTPTSAADLTPDSEPDDQDLVPEPEELHGVAAVAFWVVLVIGGAIGLLFAAAVIAGLLAALTAFARYIGLA